MLALHLHRELPLQVRGKGGDAGETGSGNRSGFALGRSLDHLLAEFRRRPDILKIDVEGAEKEIFSKNYESWLGKVNVIMIELHDHIRGGCAKTFYSATDKFNFKKVLQKGNLVIVVREGADLSL